MIAILIPWEAISPIAPYSHSMTEKYLQGRIIPEADEASGAGPEQRTPKFVGSCGLLILD